jgi:hypothetical protein
MFKINPDDRSSFGVSSKDLLSKGINDLFTKPAKAVFTKKALDLFLSNPDLKRGSITSRTLPTQRSENFSFLPSSINLFFKIPLEVKQLRYV